MARYHFHSVDGYIGLDVEGIDLPDVAAARRYAARYLGELLQHEPKRFWEDGHAQVEVVDEHGRLLFTVSARPVISAPGPSGANS